MPFVILSRKLQAQAKGVYHSVTILDVDTPEMKIKPLLQIQGNMLSRFLSPMKNVWGKAKEDQDATIRSRSPRTDLCEFCDHY